MTVDQAIRSVRMLLDEPKFEYFGSSTDLDGEFRDALRQAAAQVAREMHLRGEKDAVLPVYVEEQVAITSVNVVVPTLPMLEVCDVWSNWDLDLASVTAANTIWMRHAYATPEEFYRRAWRATLASPTPTAGISATQRFSATLEYTLDGGNIVVNRDPTVLYENDICHISYLSVPVIPALGSDPLPLSAYIHGYICDVAAGIMYRKEHPGDDRPALGGLLDLEGAIVAVRQRGGAQ